MCGDAQAIRDAEHRRHRSSATLNNSNNGENADAGNGRRRGRDDHMRRAATGERQRARAGGGAAGAVQNGGRGGVHDIDNAKEIAGWQVFHVLYFSDNFSDITMPNCLICRIFDEKRS